MSSIQLRKRPPQQETKSSPGKRGRIARGAFLLFIAIFLLCAIRILFLPIGAPLSKHQTRQPDHYDYEGDIHFHTKYERPDNGTYEKLSAVTNRLHLDFVVITEHNNLEAFLDHKEGWYGNTLFLTGVEISRPEGYLLGLDLHEYPITRSWSTDRVLTEIVKQNGIALIAHPASPRWKWRGADDPRTIGQEIVDLTDQFNSASAPSLVTAAIYYPFNRPASFMQLYHYPSEALEIWDRKTTQRPFAGIYAPDLHHDFHQRLFPTNKEIFINFPNAEDVIPFGHNHIILNEPFTHNPSRDKELIYDAVRHGHLYVAIDLLQDATGFFFNAKQNERAAWMGDSLPAGKQTAFFISLPPTPFLKNTSIHIYHNGREIAESTGSSYKFNAESAGAYRVEVRTMIPTFWGFGREVTWIYSNPIYLR